MTGQRYEVVERKIAPLADPTAPKDLSIQDPDWAQLDFTDQGAAHSR